MALYDILKSNNEKQKKKEISVGEEAKIASTDYVQQWNLDRIRVAGKIIREKYKPTRTFHIS